MRCAAPLVDDVQALHGRLNFGVLGQQQDAHEGLVYMLDQGRRDAYQQQQGWTVLTMKPRFKQICTTCGYTNHVGEGGESLPAGAVMLPQLGPETHCLEVQLAGAQHRVSNIINL